MIIYLCCFSSCPAIKPNPGTSLDLRFILIFSATSVGVTGADTFFYTTADFFVGVIYILVYHLLRTSAKRLANKSAFCLLSPAKFSRPFLIRRMAESILIELFIYKLTFKLIPFCMSILKLSQCVVLFTRVGLASFLIMYQFRVKTGAV